MQYPLLFPPKNKSKCYRLKGTMIFFIMLLLGFSPQAIFCQNFKFLGPDVVVQGKSFTGIVVDESEDGGKPVSEGSTIHTTGGQVVVGPGGKVTMPPIPTQGNVFRGGEVFNQDGALIGPIVQKHYESVPVYVDAEKPSINQIQRVIQSNDLMVVTGIGLDEIRNPQLIDAAGRNYALTKIFSSGLQIGFWVPELPPGAYSFAGEDATGDQVSHAAKCVVPELELSGPPIKKRGTKGNVHVQVSENCIVALFISEGVIRLLPKNGIAMINTPAGMAFRLFEAQANQSIDLPFIAEQIGNWTATAYTYSPGRLPDVFKGPAVEPTKVNGPTCAYDAQRNVTTIISEIIVTLLSDGSPVSGAHMDFVVSDATGVAYLTTITGASGNATFSVERPGKISAESVYIGAYNCWEHVYKPASKSGTVESLAVNNKIDEDLVPPIPIDSQDVEPEPDPFFELLTEITEIFLDEVGAIDNNQDGINQTINAVKRFQKLQKFNKKDAIHLLQALSKLLQSNSYNKSVVNALAFLEKLNALFNLQLKEKTLGDISIALGNSLYDHNRALKKEDRQAFDKKHEALKELDARLLQIERNLKE